MDKEDIQEVFLTKFHELLCFKFNSDEISENHVFTVQLNDFKKSFSEFCEDQGVYSGLLRKLENGQISFEDVILAYDHKNITISRDMVTIFLAPDIVLSFEESNQKMFECKLITLIWTNKDDEYY